jgi:hypothetical protein
MDSKNVRHVRGVLRRADCELEDRAVALQMAQVDFDLAEQAAERAYRSWLTVVKDVASGAHNE